MIVKTAKATACKSATGLSIDGVVVTTRECGAQATVEALITFTCGREMPVRWCAFHTEVGMSSEMVCRVHAPDFADIATVIVTRSLGGAA